MELTTNEYYENAQFIRLLYQRVNGTGKSEVTDYFIAFFGLHQNRNSPFHAKIQASYLAIRWANKYFSTSN